MSEEAGKIIRDNHRKAAETHVWRDEDGNELTMTEPYELRGPYGEPVLTPYARRRATFPQRRKQRLLLSALALAVLAFFWWWSR